MSLRSNDPYRGAIPGAKSASKATVIPVASNDRYVISRVTNWSCTAIIATTGLPQPIPGFIVPSTCGVRVRGYNGTAAGNTKSVFVANYPQALLNGGGTPLAPLDDVSFPADNTAQIWVCGTAGDGVVVSVTTS